MKIKFVEEKIMKGMMLVTTLLVFLFVGSILFTIIKNGWPALSWEMITSLPGGGFYIGKEGGLLNAIVGSLYVVGASTVLGLMPLSIATMSVVIQGLAIGLMIVSTLPVSRSFFSTFRFWVISHFVPS